MLRVDTHVHFWDQSVVPIDWLVHVPTLNRPYLPEHLLIEQPTPADAWVFVESGTRGALAEARWALRLAENEPRLCAFIAGIPLLNPNERQQLLCAYREIPLVHGVRCTLIGQSTDVLRCTDLIDGLHAVQAEGLTLDLNLESTQLDDAAWLARQMPGLMIALDHAGNPEIVSEAFPKWADALAHLAEYPNTVCKLSGLVTRPTDRNSQDGEGFDYLRPWIRHVIDCFGPDRVMIGSDFPIICQRTNSTHWFSFLTSELQSYSSAHQVSMWGGAANRFYRLNAASVACSEKDTL